MDKLKVVEELLMHRALISECLNDIGCPDRVDIAGLRDSFDAMMARLGVHMVNESGDQHAAA